MVKIRLEAPWYTFRKKLYAMFALDPKIEVGEVYQPEDGEADYAIDIEVKDHQKFVALDRTLPTMKMFGNVTLRIYLYDEENSLKDPAIDLYKTIFDGNPIVKNIKELVDQAGVSHSYVRFKPEVIQFFDDDLSDYNGNWSGLAQDIAKEVFDDSNWMINFCTADINEVGEEVSKPLGEWP